MASRKFHIRRTRERKARQQRAWRWFKNHLHASRLLDNRAFWQMSQRDKFHVMRLFNHAHRDSRL